MIKWLWIFYPGAVLWFILKKKPEPSETQNVGLTFCLDYRVWPEDKATPVVPFLPIFSLQQEVHYGITSKNMGQQSVSGGGKVGEILFFPLIQCFLHAELSLDSGQHGPGWPAVLNRHMCDKVACVQWRISGHPFVGWKRNVWHHAEVILTIWWVKTYICLCIYIKDTYIRYILYIII